MPVTPPRSPLVALGLRLSDWFERWFPDAFALALTAVAVVFAASVATGNSVAQTAQWFGQGFWDLVAFTMQMSLIIVTGYAVATSPPVYAAIRALAAVPRSGPAATAFVGLFSMLTSMVSWSFSLIFSGLLAREVTHRIRGTDYRSVGAAAYLGLGSVWALGLSSSAALIMAAPASLPDSIERISGVIPLGETLGLWQSLLVAGVLIVVSTAICFFSAPGPHEARGMAEMGVAYQPVMRDLRPRETPGEWLEHSPLLTVFFCAAGALFLAREAADNGPAVLLELNHYIFAFLVAGMLLHWRLRSFVQAVTASVTPVGGILIQYPLYAGIVGIMTQSGLAARLAEAFVAISTRDTFPVMVAVYSAVLGLFIPSAGGKWLVEAPYLLEASKTLEVNLGWLVQTYNAAEALPNLIHPFWMLPLVGILGLKARDIVGYSMLQFLVHVPIVLFLVWALNYTLAYVPPALP